MSIQSEIDRIENNVAATYSNLEEMGADMPETQNTNNLPETVLTVKAVRYDEQTLSETQKSQARNNIGAASAEEVSAISQEIDDLKENGGGSSVQSDYAQTDSTQPDFIKNKIVGDVVEYGDTLTWDGKDPGLGFSEVFMGGAMPAMVFYRVSDNIVTEEDLINGISTTFYTSLDGTEEMHVDLTLEDLDIIDGCVADFVNGSVFFITKDNVTIEDLGVTFEKKGIYFMEQMGVQYSKSITIPGYTFATKTVKKLAPEYMEPFESVTEETDTLTWDGNTTGLVQLGEGIPLYKVSDATPTFSDLENGFTIHNTDISEEPLNVDNSLMPIFLQQTPSGTIVIGDGLIGIVPSDNFTDADMGITNAQKGVYFSKQSDSLTLLLTIPNYTFTKTSDKIKEKYLPAVEWDNVKDKPFGIDWDNPTVLTENQAFEIAEDMPMATIDFAIKRDKFYEVICNGVLYHVYPKVSWNDGSGTAGMRVIYISSSNEAFDMSGPPSEGFQICTIVYPQASMYTNSIMFAEAGSYTFSVYEYNATPLPDVYANSPVFYNVIPGETNDFFYLCADYDGTKITKERLRNETRNRMIIIRDSIGMIHYPVSVNAVEDSGYAYGIVALCYGQNGEHALVYTAEYTP